MAIACPIDLDTSKLRAEIQSIYARVAADPSAEFHFHRGPEYASARLQYDADELSKLPRTVTESFAGVGNPHAIAAIPAGATIVDIGSGAGTDLLLAALHVRQEIRAAKPKTPRPLKKSPDLYYGWLLPYLSRITDEHLEAGLAASGASAPVAQEFTRLIRERILQLQRIAESSTLEKAVK